MRPQYRTESDRDLEALAASGDRDAFAELYSRHFDRVYDFLNRMVRDADEAADLAQETFLRAMRALSPKEKKASFSTWLFTIARNLALKRLERQRRIVTPPEREVEEEEERAVYRQVDPARFADPQEMAQAQELSGLVWQAAAGLDAKQYSLLDLHVRQGLDSAEIAEVLGVSTGNAYTMMSRLKDSFESAVAALQMLQRGRKECADLNRLLEERRITLISPDARRLIDRHIAGCATCQEQRRRLVSPTAIFGSFAAAPVPFGLKPRIADALMGSWAEAGSEAVGGLKGLLSQSVARVGSLPTAWKAALVASLLIVAVGGGLGGWIGAGGGAPLFGDGGEDRLVVATATVAPSPTPSPIPGPPATPSPTPMVEREPRLIFVRGRDAETSALNGVLFMSDIDGSNAVQLTPDDVFASFVALRIEDDTPTLYYVAESRPGSWSLFRRPLSSEEATPILEIEGGGYGALDSSERYLALSHANGIDLVDLSTRDRTHLLTSNAEACETGPVDCHVYRSPQWSPDGSLLLVSKAFWEGGTQVMIDPFDAAPLESQVGTGFSGTWSQSGKTVCTFGLYGQPSGLFLSDAPNWADAEDVLAEKTEFATAYVDDCQWVSDTLIAFTVQSTFGPGQAGIFLFDRTTEEARLVADLHSGSNDILAVPDAQFVVYQTFTTEPVQPHLVRLSDGVVTPISEDTNWETRPYVVAVTEPIPATFTPVSPPTPIPEPEVSVPKPTSCPLGDVSFCDFVHEVDAALASGDISHVVSHTEFVAHTCGDFVGLEGAPLTGFAPADCEGQPPDKVVDCIDWTFMGGTHPYATCSTEDVFAEGLGSAPYRVVGIRYGCSDEACAGGLFLRDPTQPAGDAADPLGEASILLGVAKTDVGWTIREGSQGFLSSYGMEPEFPWPPQ